MGMLRMLCGALAGLALGLLPGCSSDKDAEVRQETAQLRAENDALRLQVGKLGEGLRSLQAKVDGLDLANQNMEKLLVQVKTELQARLTDMVERALQGRGGRVGVVNPPPIPRVVQRACLAFDGQDLQEDVARALDLKATTGVLVTNVREGDPAGAGFQKHDVVQRLNDTEIKSLQDLKRALNERRPGEVVTVAVLRGEQKLELKVTLGAKQERVFDQRHGMVVH